MSGEHADHEAGMLRRRAAALRSTVSIRRGEGGGLIGYIDIINIKLFWGGVQNAAALLELNFVTVHTVVEYWVYVTLI